MSCIITIELGNCAILMWVFNFRCRTFRQALDAEMRESNKLRIAQDCKIEKREKVGSDTRGRGEAVGTSVARTIFS